MTERRAIYFHCAWSTYQRNVQVKDIPKDVTDICYAFWGVDKDGNIYSLDSWGDLEKRFVGVDGVSPPDSWNDVQPYYGNFGQFRKLKQSGRKFNLQLTLGGWTGSGTFSDAVSTPSKISNFVSSITKFLKTYDIFNGLCFDWEYLSNDGVNYGKDGNVARREDFNNFVTFINLLRKQLPKEIMLSFCVGAFPEKVKFPIETLHPLFERILVMTYDFHDGAWGETQTMHHTNPRKSSKSKWSCEEAADFFIAKGVPRQKVFIGGAFYSRGFSNTNGLCQPASGGSTDMSWEQGIVDYKDLPRPGAKEYFDDEAKAPYTYDPVKRVFNSYDNERSLQEKCKIIAEKNLGGICIWETSGDKLGKLTNVIRDNLNVTSGNVTSGNVTPSTGNVTPSTGNVTPSAGNVTTSGNVSLCSPTSIKISFDLSMKDYSIKNTKVEVQK